MRSVFLGLEAVCYSPLKAEPRSTTMRLGVVWGSEENNRADRGKGERGALMNQNNTQAYRHAECTTRGDYMAKHEVRCSQQGRYFCTDDVEMHQEATRFSN
jgi:hypothetical protein